MASSLPPATRCLFHLKRGVESVQLHRKTLLATSNTSRRPRVTGQRADCSFFVQCNQCTSSLWKTLRMFPSSHRINSKGHLVLRGQCEIRIAKNKDTQIIAGIPTITINARGKLYRTLITEIRWVLYLLFVWGVLTCPQESYLEFHCHYVVRYPGSRRRRYVRRMDVGKLNVHLVFR